MRTIFILLLSIVLLGCKQKEVNNVESTSSGEPTQLYDWTGTYSCKNDAVTYQLKLHKRSVDASYEMLYSEDGDRKGLFDGAMWHAHDSVDMISVQYMGNFNQDPSQWPYKKGDLLFKMYLNDDKSISTQWHALQPSVDTLTFVQISKNFN